MNKNQVQKKSSYEWETKFKREPDGTWVEQLIDGRLVKYEKKSKDEVRRRGFCGWEKIMDLANECMKTSYYADGPDFLEPEIRSQLREKLRRRDRILIIVLFLTGGRISEVLMLKKMNFYVEDERIIVEKMPLLKRVEVKKTLIDETPEVPPADVRRFYQWDRRTDMWRRYEKTYVPIIMIREDFPIPRWEPFTDELISYVDEVDDWLFPTDYKNGKVGSNPGIQKWITEVFKKEYKNKEYRMWISPTRAYQIVRSVGHRVDKDEHWWDHRFRAERASQMRSEYQFRDIELDRFFGWKPGRDTSQARKYGGISMQDVWERMVAHKDVVIRKMRTRFNSK